MMNNTPGIQNLGSSQSADQTHRLEGRQSSLVLEEIRRMNKAFSSSLRLVSDRVDRLVETVYGPPPPKKRLMAESELRAAWADRLDTYHSKWVGWTRTRMVAKMVTMNTRLPDKRARRRHWRSQRRISPS